MTLDQTRRVHEAIADCDRFIAREESRSDELRPADQQKLLEYYKSHRIALLKRLEA